MYFCAAVIVSCLVCWTAGYPSGAPIETCKKFAAEHTDHNNKPYPPQNSQSKYEIIITPSTIPSGQSVTVTLQGVGEKFKGFFIQGQDKSGRPVGTFKPKNDAQTRDCPPGVANSATHVNSNDKSKVILQWEAPSTYKGEVVFRAVVVKTYEIFWNNLVSSSLIVV